MSDQDPNDQMYVPSGATGAVITPGQNVEEDHAGPAVPLFAGPVGRDGTPASWGGSDAAGPGQPVPGYNVSDPEPGSVPTGATKK